MKVLLVMPNESAYSPYPMQRKAPLLGIAYIGAVLRQHGYEVDIIDAGVEQLSARDALQRALACNATAVGISVNLLSYAFASALAVGCHDHGIPVVVGGPEATLNADTVMSKIEADVAVMGEGEQTIIELLQVLQFGGQWNSAGVAHIRGIMFRDSDGNPTSTIMRPRIADLDRLPFVSYNMLPMNRYDLRYPVLPAGPVFPVYTSRGCPFNCSFCSSREIWRRRCVFMSAPRVVEELDHMVRTYSPAGIYFRDDHFTLNRERVIDICEGLLKRDLCIPWGCLGRAEGLDEDLFRLMKRAGCQGMWFGVESGSPRVLSFIRKEISLESLLEVVHAGKRAGLAMGASVIVGFPTQTREEEDETIRFLKKAKFTFVMMAPYIGYPGSDMYREFLSPGTRYVWAEKNGITLPNSEEMTWPQKVEWAQRQERRFNRTIRHARYRVRSLGLVPVLKEQMRRLLSNITQSRLTRRRNHAPAPNGISERTRPLRSTGTGSTLGSIPRSTTR